MARAAALQRVESGAILLYLVETTRQFFAAQLTSAPVFMNVDVAEGSALGPMPGRCHHFQHRAANKSDRAYGLKRFMRNRRLYGVLIAASRPRIRRRPLVAALCDSRLVVAHERPQGRSRISPMSSAVRRSDGRRPGVTAHETRSWIGVGSSDEQSFRVIWIIRFPRMMYSAVPSALRRLARIRSASPRARGPHQPALATTASRPRADNTLRSISGGKCDHGFDA